MMKTGVLKPNFLSFFEQTPDLVCVAGKDGFFKFVNKSVEDKLGYSLEELMMRPISSFILKEDRKLTATRRADLFGGKPLVNFENRYVSKTGKIIWLYWTSLYLPDQDLVFGIAKDITEKKELELDINEKYEKFKYLVNHFKSNIEKDRKHFALELHEELAQLASVIKLNLKSVTNAHPELPESIRKPLDHASFISELMVNTIRKISFEISPYMLEGHGLKEVLKMLCNDFSIINEIECKLETDFKEDSLTQEVRVDFFRICQEALKNVMLYSEAYAVNITLMERESLIELTVIDDGIGFDIGDSKDFSCLESIRDRVASINGRLSIRSEPGKGSMIRVEVEKVE